METAAQAKARLDAQNAYGKWNVASAANAYHAARLHEMSPARRAVELIAGRVALAALFAVSYGLPFLAIWHFFA